jgi:Leucine-rich repeat (LRR) protein
MKRQKKNSKLDLSNKKLCYLIPEHIHGFSLNQITKLNLSNNQLQDLPWDVLAQSLPQLRNLYLGKNIFYQIPSGIGLVTSLKRLYFNDNTIETISSEISKLVNLQKLQLQHNKLKFLPSEISQLTSLIRMNLSYNNLQTLPPEMHLLTQLKSLNIANNPLISPPPFMINKNTAAILHFLKQQYESLKQQHAFRYNISGSFPTDQQSPHSSIDVSYSTLSRRKQRSHSVGVNIIHILQRVTHTHTHIHSHSPSHSFTHSHFLVSKTDKSHLFLCQCMHSHFNE